MTLEYGTNYILLEVTGYFRLVFFFFCVNERSDKVVGGYKIFSIVDAATKKNPICG